MINPELSRRLQTILPSARAEALALPKTPEIELFLINADFHQKPLSQEEMLAVLEEPAYWAFCWASGQVLAKFLLDNPSWVAGKRVLDFGCGSGVVAIAAAMAGARRVIACDIDPAARNATRINAAHNQQSITLAGDFIEVTEAIDIIIVADVLYDRENLPWLQRFIERAPEVLVADSRVKNFNFPPYEKLRRIRGSTVPDFDEFDEFRDVNIYHANCK